MAFTTTPPRNDYVGNGATAVYGFGFRIFAATDLRVVQENTSGVLTVLSYPGDFTVPSTDINNPNGGNITLTAGNLPSLYKLTIRFKRTTQQATDLRNQGGYFAEIHEDKFDEITRFVQQQEDDIRRALRGPDTDVVDDDDMVMPSIALRASKFLAFDSNGKPIATAAVVSTAPISVFMLTLVDDNDAAAAMQTLFAEELSPGQITSNQNNYNPASLSPVNVLRINSDASRNITGLSGGVDGRILIVHNIGSFNIILTDDDAASTAGNRFALSGNLTLYPDTGCLLRYDAISSRWRLVHGQKDIPKSIGTAKGDIIVFTAADVAVRKAAGADAFINIYDSLQSDGIAQRSIWSYLYGK